MKVSVIVVLLVVFAAMVIGVLLHHHNNVQALNDQILALQELEEVPEAPVVAMLMGLSAQLETVTAIIILMGLLVSVFLAMGLMLLISKSK